MSEAARTLRKALDLPTATIQVRQQSFPRHALELAAVFPEIGEIVVPLRASQARELAEALLELADGFDVNEDGDLN